MISRLAFYPMHWAAVESLARETRGPVAVVAASPPSIPSVHQSLGWVDPAGWGSDGADISVLRMPDDAGLKRILWLLRFFLRFRPDAVWIQEEPTSDVTFDVLAALSLLPTRPRVGVAVCENIFGPLGGRSGALKRWLWRRVDVLLATATASIDGIREVGMPENARGVPLIAGAMPAPSPVSPLDLKLARSDGDLIAGFVGRICPEKGWRVLLDAIARLPSDVKCALAGEGPDVNALHERMQNPLLKGRISYVGLLPKNELWRFYAAVDCVVLPSLTCPTWKEQFGGVLADGMAMGLPLIGSDSGAIPEVIGPAGLVAPEGDAQALAAAIGRLWSDPGLRARLGEAGRYRFATEFDIPAYAGKIGSALGVAPTSARQALAGAPG